jgi:hypothetical protein
MIEARLDGYRAYAWNADGFLMRKETTHGVFMRALVRYAPESK